MSETATNNIQQQIQDEIAEARAICNADGSNKADCAAAWDAVEELQAEASHQKEKQPETTPFQQYCDDNPDAAECRVYDD